MLEIKCLQYPLLIVKGKNLREAAPGFALARGKEATPADNIIEDTGHASTVTEAPVTFRSLCEDGDSS